MKKVINILAFIIVTIAFIYVGSNIYKSYKPTYISYEYAIDTLYKCSPINSAHFYTRFYKTNSFLTQLFIDSIIPYFEYSNYNELKNINIILSKTPISKYITPIYQKAKDDKYKDIVTDLDNYREEYIHLLNDSILPLLIIEADSVVENSINNIFNDYAGGFMNYKKIGFFFGRDSEDFIQCWNNESESFYERYKELNDSYIKSYLSTIDTIRESYFKEWIPYFDSNISRYNELFNYKFEVSEKQLSYVTQYTNKETDEMIYDTAVDFIIDAGTIAAGSIIGGPVGAFLTSTGGLAIGVGTGVYQSLNEINQLDSDEKFKYTCTEFTLEDLEQYYIKQANILKLNIKKDDDKLLKIIKGRL